MTVFLLIAALICATLAEGSRKRAIDCLATEINTWSETCVQSSEGTFCLSAAEAGTPGPTCGCKSSADCIVNSDFPYCSKGGICESCEASGAGNDEHYFCRDRFPSEYNVAGGIPADPDMDPLVLPNTENVATLTGTGNFFREVCIRNTAGPGSCQRCNQASPDNTKTSYPDYAAIKSLSLPADAPTLSGLWGTFHCDSIRPTRPICADTRYFADAGIPDMSLLKTTMDIAHATGGMVKPNVERNVLAWRGACVPCGLIETSSGTTKFYHELCFNALATSPVCKGTGCEPCANDAECLANGLTAKTGFFSGGRYCFTDGHCGPCTTDAECVTKFGVGQTCSAGMCVAPTLCKSNDDCADNQNCMDNGSCRACTDNADCFANDGPVVEIVTQFNDQPICSAGVCRYCNINSDCNAAAGGNNCMADGTCKSCTAANSATVCAVNVDGGEPSGGAVTVANANDQTLCNTDSGICETPCTDNTFCSVNRAGSGFNRGANCQADGTCKDCTVSPNSCGTLDGPSVSGQTTCDPVTKLCFSPFTCTVNANCDLPANTGLGKNCQKNGNCESCVVSHTSTTCGSVNDGGETPNQLNCNQASRRCVDTCATNAQCVGTQGANCMGNGLCLDCRSDADCVDNAWTKDGGETSGQTICNPTSKQCETACASNGACPTGQNCNKDGRCRACAVNADCVTNDGPAPMGTNTVCTAGVCVNPYTCANNAGCAANTESANCQADKTCIDCKSNADCGLLDGGEVPTQPICSVGTGICGPCTKNADCPATAANCGADGACYDCRTKSGEQCTAFDGGEIELQPNCDTITGICVNFCTMDEHCAEDDCLPYCNIERGCCAECTTNEHCPHQRWRSPESLNTECSDGLCHEPHGCIVDADCAETAGKPACSITQGICVECVFDAHCPEGKKACATNQQMCVECVSDDYCTGETESCASDNQCVEGSSAAVSVSVLVGTVAVLFRLF